MRRPLLASEVVRFVGEPVAAIVADTSAQAADAADAVWIDYEPLPAVVDPEQALADASPRVFAEAASNVAVSSGGRARRGLLRRLRRRRRDSASSTSASPLSRWSPGPPRQRGSTAASWQWSATQNAHGLRDTLAQVHGLDPSAVRVIAPDVGGGFGAKRASAPRSCCSPGCHAGSAAPSGGPSPAARTCWPWATDGARSRTIAIGGTRDGRVLAYHLSIVQEAGAYPAMGSLLPYLTRMMASGTYDIGRDPRRPSLGGHEHSDHARLPRRRTARSDCRDRTVARPVRGRVRHRSRRGAPHQPHPRRRLPFHHGDALHLRHR